ncbi:hypothetical protein BGZ98_003405, partial [Dissophora globulifera]
DEETSDTDKLQLPDIVTISLHARKGDPQTRLRARKDLPEGVTWSHHMTDDNYTILCGKIRRRIQSIKGVKWPLDARPYIRPKLSTAQHNYVELSEENFADEIERAWIIERKRLGKDAEVKVHIFAYLIGNTSSRRNLSGTGNDLQHATDPPFRAANEVIKQAVRQGVIGQIGSIATSHLSRTITHRPNITSPNENVAPEADRQTQQHLERPAHALPGKRRAETDTASEEYMDVRVKIKIHVGDLRRILGLPAFSVTNSHDFE